MACKAFENNYFLSRLVKSFDFFSCKASRELRCLTRATSFGGKLEAIKNEEKGGKFFFNVVRL